MNTWTLTSDLYVHITNSICVFYYLKFIDLIFSILIYEFLRTPTIPMLSMVPNVFVS